MPDFLQMGNAVLLAANVAAWLLLLVAWPGRTPRPWRLRLGWVLGLGAGFYAGCAVFKQWPRWPAPEDRDRFLVILLPLTLAVEIVAALVPRPRWLAWLLRLGVAGAAAPILLYHSAYVADLSGPNSAKWSSTESVLIFFGLAAALLAVWGLLALLQARTSERSAAPTLVLTALAAGVTVMLTGYFYGGLLGLILAGAIAGATLASFAAPAPPDTGHYLGVGMIGLFTVLLSGHFFSDLPTSTAVCLLLAPLLAWLPELPGPRRLLPSIRDAARFILVAVPLVFVVLNAEKKPTEAPATTPNEFDVTSDDYKSFGK